MKNNLKQFKDVIGLKIHEAEALHTAHIFRAVKVNNQFNGIGLTTDMRPNRVNVAVENDVITEVLNIG